MILLFSIIEIIELYYLFYSQLAINILFPILIIGFQTLH